MDEEEIELWYDDEKQTLTEKYIADIQSRKDLRKLKIEFDAKLAKLNVQFAKKNTKLENLIDKKKRRAKQINLFLGPIRRSGFAIGSGFIVSWEFFDLHVIQKYRDVRHALSIWWIINGYKPKAYVVKKFQPVRMWHYRVSKPVVLAIGRPVHRVEEYFSKKYGQYFDWFMARMKVIIKHLKQFAKKVNAIIKVVTKWLTEHIGVIVKAYNARYSARLQKKLERKQAKKEAKEKKLKEKEAVAGAAGAVVMKKTESKK
jgi:hypothetical protein